MRLHIDFETRSTVDLRKSGVYRYAEDPNTDVIMACWAVDGGPVQTWFHTEPSPADLLRLLDDPKCVVVAHNAGFERAMLQYILGPRYGWPVPAVKRWDDTAARAARQSLPRSLDGASQALGLHVTKDVEGQRLMMRMCRPRSIEDDGKIVWWDDASRMQRLAEYCAQDVEVERALDDVLRPLTREEQEIWFLTEKINDRGVFVNHDFAKQAITIANKAQFLMNEELSQLSDGAIAAATNIAQFKSFLSHNGLNIFDMTDDSLNKKAVDNLLKTDLTPKIRRVLEIRRDGGKSSVAKYQAIIDRVSNDGRVRGNLMYHGASTGRWSGAGVQLQNLPRETVKDWEKSAKELTPDDPKALAVLSRMIRGTVCASPGMRLVWADYAAIEARGVAWLAGQTDLVELFATGGKVYEEMAASIFRVPVAEIGKDSMERFLGKTVVLGCFEADTLVLTNRGWIPIIYVQQTDLLWDGKEWVNHQGLIYQGIKTVHRNYGIGATPDHEILTEHGWREWKEVHISPFLMKSALKLANLPLSIGSAFLTKPDEIQVGIQSVNVRVGGLGISIGQILLRGVQSVATVAASVRHTIHKNIIGVTQALFPMTHTAFVYSTEFQQLFNGVIIRKAETSIITAGEGFWCTRLGEMIGKNFCNIFSNYKDGTTQFYNWIGLTTTAGTNRAICGLLPQPKMSLIGAVLERCKNKFKNYRKKSHVYDIALAGPRNRFTILTDNGPIIVHNCGYSMGPVKFRQTVAGMGTTIDEELAHHAVNTYRTKYAAIPQLWNRLNEATIAAIKTPKRETTYRQVSFYCDGDWLLIKLPSGRKLFYRNPRVVKYAGPYGERDTIEYMAVNSLTKKWGHERTFGGKLTENIVQGLCRDLIAGAMLDLEAQDYSVVGSVHDEIICEVPDSFGSIDEMISIMCRVPDWAKGFPIAAEAKEGKRYGK